MTLDADGCVIRRQVVSANTICRLRAILDDLQRASQTGETKTARCLRNLLACDDIRRLALSDELLSVVTEFDAAAETKPPRPVRGLLFDKTDGANWRVGWHQDLVTAFAAPIEAPGYSAWSTKAGVTHAKPPIELLESMVTVRLHLDDCGAENGPLEILPCTHRSGELSDEAIRNAVAKQSPMACTAEMGDAVVMRPLVLHASSKATSPTQRRVLHLEYAFNDPPGGAAWPIWQQDR